LLVKNMGASSAGLVLQGSGGEHVMQLYGAGSNYGFLNGAWAGWDIQKTVSGNMYLNGNATYYLNPPSNSHFNTISTAGTGTFSGDVDITGDVSVTGDGVFSGTGYEKVGAGITPSYPIHAYAATGDTAIRAQIGVSYIDLYPHGHWNHIIGSSAKFYFNKEIQVDSGFIGSFDSDLQLRTQGTTRLTLSNSTGDATFGGAVTWSGGGSANANTAYTHSQASHAPSNANYITNNNQLANGAQYIPNGKVCTCVYVGWNSGHSTTFG
jgi:hypothetical protein